MIEATVTRAITIRAPWSIAVRAGRKLVENRGRPTSWRGPVAIHTGAAWSKEGARDPRILDWWYGAGQWPAALDATDFAYAFRKIVAVADLVDCHEAEQPHPAGATCCAPWGDRDYRGKPAWHLVLEDVRILDAPVPAVGQLAVPWALPAGTAVQVNAQLAA